MKKPPKKAPVKKQRSLDEVKTEYARACNALGEKDYAHAMLELEMRNLRQTIHDLNVEAAAIVAAAKKDTP